MNSQLLFTLFLILFFPFGGLAQSATLVRSPPDTVRNLTEGLNDLSNQIAKGLAENQKRKIAVVEFVDLKGNVTDLGRHISEKLITRLLQSGKFKVIERQVLNKIITEQKLALPGIIDPASVQKLGKLLEVDAIVSGSVSDLTKTVEINGRLIRAETGEVFSAVSVEIIKDDTVRNLMDGGTYATNSATKTVPDPRQIAGGVDSNSMATKDLGPLRVILKSLKRVTLPEGTGIQCSFQFANLDEKPIGVAINGAAWAPNPNDNLLRARLVDSNGGLWLLASSNVTGMSNVRAQQRLAYPRDWYAATDIATVLSITDEPESNLAQNGAYRLFRGSTTEIEPGQNRSVNLTFLLNGNQRTPANSFQITAEIVVGVAKTGTKKSYTLHNLIMDQVTVPGGN